jgi:FkbM family methyltransferase
MKQRVIKILSPLFNSLASNEKVCAFITRYFLPRSLSYQRRSQFKTMFPHLSLEGRSEWEIDAFINIVYTTRKIGATVVYDLGANEGVWSLAFAEAYNNIHVHAFEPLPDVYSTLVKRVGSHARIATHNIGFGSSKGTVQMYQDKFSPASSLLKMTSRSVDEYPQAGEQHLVQVQIERMDEYVATMHLPIPDLLKIDVQGYEDEVIAGGKEVIRQSRYVWIELSLVPLYENGSTFHSTYKTLSELGYSLFDITYLDRSVKDQTLLQMDALFINRG